MSHKNLIVLINAAPLALIKSEFPDHHIYTDADIYSIFNGNEYFFSKPYTIDDIEQFCQSIEAHAKKFNILIHTFNPLIINYLEGYPPHEDLRKNTFSTPLSIDRFFIYNKNEEFVKILENPAFAGKLDCLSMGEAVADSNLRDYE